MHDMIVGNSKFSTFYFHNGEINVPIFFYSQNNCYFIIPFIATNLFINQLRCKGVIVIVSKMSKKFMSFTDTTVKYFFISDKRYS
jgi:hypothetical protein